MIAEGDTYQKYPDDETYPQLAVNYVRLDQLPKFDEDSTATGLALQTGDFFVTTGEVLFRKWGVEGSGPHPVYMANVEWTFPLEFVEVIGATGTPPTEKEFLQPEWRLSAIMSSAFPLLEEATSGCVLRFGTLPATGPSLSQFT
jgi:hypothetical protein